MAPTANCSAKNPWARRSNARSRSRPPARASARSAKRRTGGRSRTRPGTSAANRARRATHPLSAGAVAKLALTVEAQGGNPESVEGRNLISDLECLQVGSGPEAGRFSDKNQTNYSDVSGQSYAIIALKACEANCASKPNLKTSIEAGAAYLRAQQCAGSKPKSLNGAFRSTMGLPASTCNDEPPFTEVSENENAVEVDSAGDRRAGAADSRVGRIENCGRVRAEVAQTRAQEIALLAELLQLRRILGDLPERQQHGARDDGRRQAGVSVGKAQKWLDGIVEGQPTGEQGLPACTESGPPEVLATAQGIIGMYGTTYPHLVGLP